jgi:hypothetical protein
MRSAYLTPQNKNAFRLMCGLDQPIYSPEVACALFQCLPPRGGQKHGQHKTRTVGRAA